MKQRNHAFDLLCGLCIIRMVCLHIMTFCNMTKQDWWAAVMDWSFFFMCFFFFKAGFFNKTVKGDTKTYVWDKTKRLLIPYFTTGAIGCAIYFAFLPPLLAKFHNPIEPLTWEHIWETSSFYGNQPVWFLFSFYTAYLIVHFIEKVPHLHWIVALFPFISYWMFLLKNPLWMSLDNVFMGVFFFYLGHLWSIAMQRFSTRNIQLLSIALVLWFVVSNILWHGAYAMSSNRFDGNFYMTMLNTSAILCGLAGVLLTFGMPRIPLLCFIGEHSMVYFVAHYPIIYIYKYTHLCFGRSIFGRADEAILLVPIVFCICSWLVPYFERVPWLSGRWKKG